MGGTVEAQQTQSLHEDSEELAEQLFGLLTLASNKPRTMESGYVSIVV